MSNRIKVLNDLTINKIAAGEVVEGPHSVVKELIENSIDANATNITIEIKDGGQSYIRVSDDGIGINEKDVKTAFLRHATSKINTIEDLNSLYSLGFRGEALASIASVSQIKVITKPRNQSYAISMEIINGEIINQKQIGAPDGTTIIVKNLFFNTPARLKFMKSPQSETRKISEIISRLSLSKPEISFKFINSNNIMLTTPGNNNIDQTIISVLDKNLYKSLIKISDVNNFMELNGYISQPTYIRGNRNLLIVFVNGRYVKNQTIYKAIVDAYKEKLPINKFPVCILNLKINPELIDVNVHPTKIEIKFDEDVEIYEFIYNIIKYSLSQNVIVPTIIFDKNNSSKDNISSNLHTKSLSTSFQERREEYNASDNYNQPIIDTIIDNDSEQLDLNDYKADIQSKINYNNNYINEKEITQKNFLNNILTDYKIIGQLFSTYIILEKNLFMYLIDQHAAHERLVYNKLLEEYKNNNVTRQKLLKPEVLELTSEDYIFIIEHLNKFINLGFNIEIFGTNSIIVREVPLIMGKPRDFQFLFQIIDELKNEVYNEVHFNETIIRKSCREAIKAMDKLTTSEIHQLIKDLSKIDPPLTCPHGRPILLSLSKYEIEKNFKRVQ
ncbi:MAG: DNA mismatch repair endonuclease MutL [Clostridiales bacterium]|nr:DNA mismatch repair endonuclease MutL [Clostridiales bacterium]